MRLAYRPFALLLLLLPGCHMSSDGPAGSDDAGGPGPADATPPPDGGERVDADAGPTRYVDLIFSSEELEVVRDILYATVTDEYGTHRLLLDLYRPADDPVNDRPAIVWVHGGFFRTGTRAMMSGYAREFARRGYVTASIEYRLLKAMNPDKGPQEAAEVAQEDVESAMRYLTAHAAEYGIDPARFIVGGHSAGSITSFQVGYRYEDAGHDEPVVIGVAALEGVLIKPDDFAAGDPPFILIRSGGGGGGGPHDCPTGDCEYIFTELIEAADALGIANDMVHIPGATHPDLIAPEFVPTISAIVAPFLYQNAL